MCIYSQASVVQLIRENLHVMSLAIGDGANDVSMLQMAEVRMSFKVRSSFLWYEAFLS